MADAVPFFLMLLFAVASAAILQIRRSLRLGCLLASAALLSAAAAWTAAPGTASQQAATISAADTTASAAEAGAAGRSPAVLLWSVWGIGAVTAVVGTRPWLIAAVVGAAALLVSRLHYEAPASTAAAWIATWHLWGVTGLVGAAVAGFGIVCSGAAVARSVDRTRWMARLAAALLLGLVAAAVAALLTADEPLGLAPQLALLVLPAEALAGLCVWRGWEQLLRSAARAESAGWATLTGVLAVFAMAGIGLAIVPVILWAAGGLR